MFSSSQRRIERERERERRSQHRAGKKYPLL